MVAEKIEVDKGGLTKEEKETFILDFYEELEYKKPYCVGLAKRLEEMGFGPQRHNSLQTNHFSRGLLPKEEIKINIYYEYTVEYQSKLDSEAEEPKAIT